MAIPCPCCCAGFLPYTEYCRWEGKPELNEGPSSVTPADEQWTFILAKLMPYWIISLLLWWRSFYPRGRCVVSHQRQICAQRTYWPSRTRHSYSGGFRTLIISRYTVKPIQRAAGMMWFFGGDTDADGRSWYPWSVLCSMGVSLHISIRALTPPLPLNSLCARRWASRYNACGLWRSLFWRSSWMDLGFVFSYKKNS